MARSALRHGASRGRSTRTLSAWTKDAVEKKFLEGVKSAEAYVRLERELTNIFAAEGNRDVYELLIPLCQACWSICEQSFGQEEEGSLYVAAREEAQRLQKQLAECNLMAMKQVNALSSVYHHDGEDTIQFFEPMQYLDQGTKDLVMMIVAEKVNQLESGSMPSEQVRAICEALGKVKSTRPVLTDVDSDADVEELLERLREAEKCACDAKEQKKEAQMRLRESESSLRESESKAAQERHEFQRQCDELHLQAETLHQEALKQQADLMAEAEEARANLRAAEARLEEAEKAQEEVLALRAACEESDAKAAALMEELQSERQASAELREEIKKEQEAAEKRNQAQKQAQADAAANLAAARRKAEELQAKHAKLEATHRDLEAKAARLEEEAAGLRAELEELRRRGANTISQGAQTVLRSTEVDTMEAENKRLKVALEELRAKLGEMMNECKKKGISTEQMDVITEIVGLKPLIQAKSVFEKLYEDALQRVDRLEKLRQRYAAERQGASVGRHEQDKPLRRGHQHAATQSHGMLEALQHSSLAEELPSPPHPPQPASPTSPPRRVYGPTAHASGFASTMPLASSPAPACASTAALEHPTPVLRDLVQGPGYPSADNLSGWRSAMSQAPKPTPVADETQAVSCGSSAGLMFPPAWVAFNSSAVRSCSWSDAKTSTQGPEVPAQQGAGRGATHQALASPTPCSSGLGTGGELARRLAASTSLPTLCRSPQHGNLRCPGGAMPRHPAGFSNLLNNGRDSSWR